MDGVTFDYLGLTFRLTTERDDDHGAPWKEEDGHGPIRVIGSREDKRPGEWLFSSDCRHATLYAYDAQAAMIEARRDEWGLSPDKVDALRVTLKREPTKGDIAAEAVRLDFEHLRGWVRDDWEYSCLKVELCDVDGDTVDGEAEYLGGVVFEYGEEGSLIKEYGEGMAHELASRLDLVTRYKPSRDAKANRRKFITQGAARIRVRN
jgi:hypothetical protein